MQPYKSNVAKHIIAGGAGFIGGHLVRRLLQSEEVKEVIVLDNFSSGSEDNLAEFIKDPRLKVFKTDICKKIPHIDGEFDLIWHLAALANPTDYEKKPVDTLNVNSDGNKNLINLARKCKAGYIYFSSSEVYGMYDLIPSGGLDEEETISHLILGKPRSPYAIGKSFGEELTRHLCNHSGIKYLIIRPFNVYGPNMDVKTNYGRVIPNFITWALKKEPLQVNGDGTQIRTFCFIDDFISATINLVKHSHPPVVANIGSRQPIRIIELARLINEILDNEIAGYLFKEQYHYEPQVRVPNINLIQALTGWEPQTGLVHGINQTINWLKNRIK